MCLCPDFRGDRLLQLERQTYCWAPSKSRVQVRESVRDLAKRELEPLNRNAAEPLSITKLSDFVDRVYLPFAKQQKRPSTYRGYKQVWSDYLEGRCKSEWLREVKTHHVQSWLEEIAREHAISIPDLVSRPDYYEESPQCAVLSPTSRPSTARRATKYGITYAGAQFARAESSRAEPIRASTFHVRSVACATP